MLKNGTAIINLPAVIDQPQLPSTLRTALETAAGTSPAIHGPHKRD
jgi:hypothetical protein